MLGRLERRRKNGKEERQIKAKEKKTGERQVGLEEEKGCIKR